MCKSRLFLIGLAVLPALFLCAGVTGEPLAAPNGQIKVKLCHIPSTSKDVGTIIDAPADLVQAHIDEHNDCIYYKQVGANTCVCGDMDGVRPRHERKKPDKSEPRWLWK
jgi:hypothetical protein